MKTRLLVVCLSLFASSLSYAASTSYYPHRLDDKSALYLTKGSFGVHADGVGDDTEALQNAIDQVQQTTRQGIVFLPEGRYRISHTVYVWPGIRVIGYGEHRPVIYLAPKTPGYQTGMGYMIFFAGARPGSEPQRNIHAGSQIPEGPRPMFPGTVPPTNDIVDANPGTFYSAMSNVDLEVGEGNPAAVGIRFHIAQHCFLSHMEFRMGSGLSGLHDVGNEAEDLHFVGGQYGIMTRKPSPGWQFTLLDSTFEGQRTAAIKEHEAGLTLVRDQFRNVPTAVSIDPGYSEELWIKDSLMENISGPALVIGNEKNPHTEINAEGVICKHVPVFASFRETGETRSVPHEIYKVDAFSHGLSYANLGAEGEIKTVFTPTPLSAMPSPMQPAIPAPATKDWVNLRDLGAKGDGVTDDTAVVQKAIAEHAAIYVPSGHYLVSDTVALKPETQLIGLHPSTTVFMLADGTPAFNGPGAPKALLSTPSGGHNIVSGIGLYTNGINNRASAAMWQAGSDSLVDDVRFLGGHGTNNSDGSRVTPYNNTHTADPDLQRRWDGQYPSLWVLNGGGGTFADIWTPDTFAQAGMYVSDTETPGHVYELSSEHHVRNEVKFNRAANWEVFALQAEEERGEGPFALPLEVDNSHDLLFANFLSYRVVSSYQPYPCTIRTANSRNIRFRSIHIYSDSKVSFDNAVCDAGGALLRDREVGSLDVSSESAKPFVADASVHKLADGFFNISGAAVDPTGQLYFVDAHWQKIYRWSMKRQQIETVRDNAIDASNLLFDKAGNLIVVSYLGDGTVFTLKPDAPESELQTLKPEPAMPRPGMTAVLPVDHWRFENDFVEGVPVRPEYQYVSPDGTTFLPAGNDFVKGALYYGIKMADVLRAFDMARVVPGKPFYVTDEGEQKTYSAEVAPDGALTNLKLFAQKGGEGAAVGPDGNVYLAAGQIYVYNPEGKLLRTIQTPDRPIDLLFGGADGRTLYILARTSLYETQPIP